MNMPDSAPPTSPSPDSRANEVERRLRFGILDLLMIVTVVTFGLGIYSFLFRDSWEESRRAKIQQQLIRGIAQQLPQFPQQLADWQMVEDTSLHPPFREEGLQGSLARAYRHQSTGRTVHLALAVSPTRAVSTIPLSVMNRYEGRKLVFTGPPASGETVRKDGRPLGMATVHAHGRSGPVLFLTWSHWTNGQWQIPQPAKQYARPTDAAVQLTVEVEGPPLEDRTASGEYLHAKDPVAAEFAALCFDQFDLLLRAAEQVTGE